MPKVSVLVPCFNVERYVEECLLSIKNQTLKDIEILCINDGSTDGTLSIIERCAQGDDRFVIINKPNTGYGDSMNFGLQQAQGEYIGIVESDDFIEPNMFELLYDKAKAHDLDVSRGGYYRMTNGQDKVIASRCLPKNQICNALDHQEMFFQTPSIWAAIYRTNWLRECGIQFLPTPGASFQDTSFAFKVNLMARQVMVVEDCLLHYRIHGENSVKSTKNVYSICDEIAECIRYSKEVGLYEQLRSTIHLMQFQVYRWNYHRLESDTAKGFYRSWVREWKCLRDNGFEPESWPLSRRFHFIMITTIPSVFEVYLKIIG